MKMRQVAVFATATVGVLAGPTVAQAHLSIHPNEVPAGSFATLDIRVPNETIGANVRKVEVTMPPGILDVSTGYTPGWSVKVTKAKLAKPVQTSSGPVTERVREVVWKGTGNLGKIPSGQFLRFPITIEIPGKAGENLTFETVEFYEKNLVRWIGPPGSGNPAPRIVVTPAGGVLKDVAIHAVAPNPTGVAPEGTGTANSNGSDGDGKGLGIAALLVGALGLLAGGAALIRSRRT
jgi:uncharacterized protein YcnI